MGVLQIADSIYVEVNDDAPDSPWIIISPDLWEEVIKYLVGAPGFDDVLQ